MQFLIAIHLPVDFDASTQDPTVREDIRALNKEMIAAGVRTFVGGLRPPNEAKAVRLQKNGQLHITDGPFLETKELVGGFWVLEAKDMDEALEWGRKAAIACRVPTEVRPFYS